MATPTGTGAAPALDADAVEVAMVTWPDGDGERARLAADGVPRLLLVARDAPPPCCSDELEDWAREPFDPAEVETRAATLARRALERTRAPRVDRAGRVWLHGRCVDLPRAQVPVARLLVNRCGQVVPAEHIRAAYLDAGGSDHPKAVKAMIGRVKLRLAVLPLRLVNVRERGYLLEVRPESIQR